MIHVLYTYCCSGGCCHIVTDNNNIYDEDLDWVIEFSQKEENKNRIEAELSIAICKMLKTMTFLQRAVLFDSFDIIPMGFDYEDKYTFDIFYPNNEENLIKVLKEYDHDCRYN